jgi:hypothetical protein
MRYVQLYSTGKGGSAAASAHSRAGLQALEPSVDCAVDVADASSSLELLGLQGFSGGGGGDDAWAAAGAPPSQRPLGGVQQPELLLANLAAYCFWEQQWCDPQRLGAVLQPRQAATSDAEEAAWCRQHHLVLSSLRSVRELVATLYAGLHKHRPSFVSAAVGPPAWFDNVVSGCRRCGCLVRLALGLLLVGSCACKSCTWLACPQPTLPTHQPTHHARAHTHTHTHTRTVC